jgi:uncharacterized repeat protein (TIGR03803 family)
MGFVGPGREKGMNKLIWRKGACAAAVLGVATLVASPGQTFTTLVNFNGANGGFPFYAPLIQGADGNLYGTTYGGGNDGCSLGCGTVFKVTPSGTLTTLYSFSGPDGANPVAGLVLATDGSFYGTTSLGGANGYGTTFKITSSGALTTLHSLEEATDGAYPRGPLLQAANGDLYGTAYAGGPTGDGTIFRVTLDGALTTLHAFAASDGAGPLDGLIQANNGNFYGTTVGGGAGVSCLDGCGTVFEIAPAGRLTVLHSFAGYDGATPYAGLVQAGDGNFYGTTSTGGERSGGTIFKITAGGTLTTVHSFGESGRPSTLSTPTAGLIQATDGNLYGTTASGGDGLGTIFDIIPDQGLTVLHSFDGSDGGVPYSGLLQSTDGNLYGITWDGGTGAEGTVFRLSVGLGPFVRTLPRSGKAGTVVQILGTNLTGATSVTFNGTAAVFTIVSASLVSTTVPSGATTGKVQVTTPSDTLSSNVPFLVQP